MKTFIVNCSDAGIEQQIIYNIIQYLKDCGWNPSVSEFDSINTCLIDAGMCQPSETEPTKFRGASTEVALAPEIVEPESVIIVPAEELADMPLDEPNYSNSANTQPDITPVADIPPTTCVVMDLSSTLSISCLYNPQSPSSVLCVSSCECVDGYVVFSYGGMVHKVPKALSAENCVNKDTTVQDCSIRLLVSIYGSNVPTACLVAVVSDGGGERLILGNDLGHLMQPMEVGLTDGTIST